MNVESELAHTLEEQAARSRPTATGFDEVVRRGRRRRQLRRATQGVAVIGVIAMAGTLIGVLAAPPSEPVVTGPTEVTPDPDVVIYLCDDRQCPAITEDRRGALEEQLRSDPDVLALVHESKLEAYERFRVQFADQPDLVESVTFHEMPASFRIDLATGADVSAFRDRYAVLPGVEDVLLSPSARASLTPTAVPTR